jgi:hypothetical protein
MRRNMYTTNRLNNIPCGSIFRVPDGNTLMVKQGYVTATNSWYCKGVDSKGDYFFSVESNYMVVVLDVKKAVEFVEETCAAYISSIDPLALWYRIDSLVKELNYDRFHTV